MIKHLRAPEPRFFDFASAAAWVAAKARSLAVVLDRSTGRRLDALGLVSGSVEHFRPQSRYGGGYGVVGSVLSGVAVELAAGYTLSEAGACRLWDKSEGEHLDEGGLEFSRVGSTCYLPSTTGLAAGDVIYSAEPVYHDWAELNAMLTAAGSGFDVLGELRNRSSKGLIGGWRWRDGAIRPEGSVDFTRVTASQGATIASVTGQVLDLSDSTFVVDGGHTLRIRNITDGANVADVAAGSWTRSGAGIDAGAAVAAAVSALIAGGKSIRCWVEGLSELSIGGATSAIQILAGSVASWTSTGQYVLGRAIQRHAGAFRLCRLAAIIHSHTALSGVNKRLMAGWAPDAATNSGGGAARNAAAAIIQSAEVNGAASLAGSTAGAAITSVGLSANAASTVAYAAQHTSVCSPISGGYAGTDVSIIFAAYAAARPYIVADDGAIVSRLEL